MSAAAQLRARMAQGGMIVAPGAWDGMTARLVEQAGFDAVYMTGAGTAMARGFPDFGLLTMSEMVGNAGIMAGSVGVPLIADADTGYGNELNVTRTVREFEARGVAAIHIEDQVAPKRCGHLDGKEIVPTDEFAAKVRAACAARRNADFMIIARTDARAVAGFEDAVSRANSALRVGADMAFVEAVETLEEMAAVPRLVQGPCLLNIVPMGKTPAVALQDAEAMGYRMAILPGLLLGAVMGAADQALRHVRDGGNPVTACVTANLLEVFRRFGADEWSALRQRFSPPG